MKVSAVIPVLYVCSSPEELLLQSLSVFFKLLFPAFRIEEIEKKTKKKQLYFLMYFLGGGDVEEMCCVFLTAVVTVLRDSVTRLVASAVPHQLVWRINTKNNVFLTDALSYLPTTSVGS